jgi:hypothetical protein
MKKLGIYSGVKGAKANLTSAKKMKPKNNKGRRK